ncbi:hypothetical protein VE02_02298 [Pseudogymnoascus sp. 03VT05]|nr:hypothetical protein VE02_02298 [Pseudogymnoascus sp. 03VT05]
MDGRKERRVVADAGFLIQAFKDKPENLKRQNQKKVATVAPSSLQLHEALGIFGFQDGAELLLSKDVYSTPTYLEEAIERIKYNEAYSRTILDQILIACVYEENIISQRGGRKEPQAKSHSHPPKPQLPVDEPARLELWHKTPLSRRVLYKGEEIILSGFADYSLYYESQSKEEFATNLVIVEAKKLGFADGALPQLISYLGIVSAARREQRKRNAVVYGIASDGIVFRFCRVDNDGKFSQSAPLDWRMKGHKDRIFSTTRMIVKTAALSSLSTTPIKDPALRQMVLTTFGKPKPEIDFGIGLFEVGEEEEDDYVIIGGGGRAAGTGAGEPRDEEQRGGEGEQLVGDDEVGAGKIAPEGHEMAEAGAEVEEAGNRKRGDDEEDGGVAGKKKRATGEC